MKLSRWKVVFMFRDFRKFPWMMHGDVLNYPKTMSVYAKDFNHAVNCARDRLSNKRYNSICTTIEPRKLETIK